LEIRQVNVPPATPVRGSCATSGENIGRIAGFAVSLTSAGTETTGVVRCDQPRVLDIGSRDGRKLESVPAAVMDEVMARPSAIME
jgi:mRNA interferase ChpB